MGERRRWRKHGGETQNFGGATLGSLAGARLSRRLLEWSGVSCTSDSESYM